MARIATTTTQYSAERIQNARTGLTEGPSIFRLFVCRYEHEQKREKGGKSFFYYRSSALSLPLPTLMLLLALQPSRWEGSLPVVDAQSLLCRLGSLRPRSSGNVLALPWYELSWWHSTNILPVYIPKSTECLCPARLWRVSSLNPFVSSSFNPSTICASIFDIS